MWKIAILTSSDRGAAGEREDTSGRFLRESMKELGTLMDQKILPDDEETLVSQLQSWVDQGIDLILTTGGTGLGPRDNMPEATRRIMTREVVGMSEALRDESRKHTPMGMLSRNVCAQAHDTLIINFPGSLPAVRQLFPVVFPVLDHALSLIHGMTEHKNS
ncbi:MAG: MogA/MoaB family molybdenum cofactor biosynthesis protein [Firmicutes bacterium]|nr:MogA/MoaB family molybdenum cofactor biosynthesis protein [Bacillota bacterium]